MLFFKQLCICLFIIITILFTVGYASQPIINSHSPLTANGSPDNVSDMSFYLSYFTTNFENIRNVYSQNTNYGDFSNDLKLALSTEFIICIAISALLGISIVLAYIGLVKISKIILTVVLILMIIAMIVLQVYILGDTGISLNTIKSMFSPTLEYGVGYILMLTSLVLMIVNYFIYLFLG